VKTGIQVFPFWIPTCVGMTPQAICDRMDDSGH
jgi:hypothetical protein